MSSQRCWANPEKCLTPSPGVLHPLWNRCYRQEAGSSIRRPARRRRPVIARVPQQIQDCADSRWERICCPVFKAIIGKWTRRPRRIKRHRTSCQPRNRRRNRIRPWFWPQRQRSRRHHHRRSSIIRRVPPGGILRRAPAAAADHFTTTGFTTPSPLSNRPSSPRAVRRTSASTPPTFSTTSRVGC